MSSSGKSFERVAASNRPELADLAGFRQSLGAYFTRYRLSVLLDSEVLDNLALGMSEYFSNVIKHSATTNWIAVDVQLSSENVQVVFCDDGDNVEQLYPENPSLDQSDNNEILLESGMGIGLILRMFPGAVYKGKSVSGEKHKEVKPATAQRINSLTITIPLDPTSPIVAIIDDDLVQLELLSEYLKPDYTVLQFQDAREVIDYLQNARIDLFLCDIAMPNLDGFGLRRQLAKNAQTRLTPFIFISGQSNEEMVSRAGHLSIDSFLEKPVRKPLLLQTVERVLLRTKDLQEGIQAKLDSRITSLLWSQLPKYFGPFALDSAFRTPERGGGDFILHHVDQNEANRSLTLVIGDVMGHGEQAKFFSHSIAGYLHGLLHSMVAGQSPAELLNRLSPLIAKSDILKHSLFTCLVIKLWPDGRISVANAGHPLPWKVAEQNSAKSLLTTVPVEGILLGLTSEQYDETAITLEPGQQLLCYTDGLTDVNLTKNLSVTVEERIKELLAVNPEIDCEVLMTKLSEQWPLDQDDVTILRITRLQSTEGHQS